MDRTKLDLLCLLNDINSSICKIKDEDKLKHCEKKVKDINNFLKRKKRKTVKKKRRRNPRKQQQNITFFNKKENDETIESLDSISEPYTNNDLSTTISSVMPSVSETSEEEPNNMGEGIYENKVKPLNL